MFGEGVPLGKPKYSLERIEAVLRNLGSPQLKVGRIVHVAGTNGKGSTIAYLRSIFEHAGYKVHAYTSPHLVNVNERILLNGHPISSTYLSALSKQVERASSAASMQISLFELITAAAFIAFSQNQSDLVLLETGLGGRLDATNLIANPLLTIITPISYDHEAILGSSLSLIAKEKAGIMKKGVLCIVSSQENEALSALKHESAKVGCAIRALWDNFSVSDIKCKSSSSSQSIYYEFNFTSDLFQGALKCRLKNLKGRHQIINAATAIYASMLLCKEGYKVEPGHIKTGVELATWPGRLEQIKQGRSHLVTYDGAHNEAGAKALANWIADVSAKVSLIIAINARKDPFKFLSQLKSVEKKISKLIFISISSTCSVSPDILVEIARSIFSPLVSLQACPSIKEAMSNVPSKAEGGAEILIAGSLYLAGDVYKYFGK